MSVFDGYANYYDLLNQDKDYESEVKYIDGLIQRYAPYAKTILELGCGTGIHSYMFAEKGYTVHGVDQSSEMLSLAESRWREQPKKICARLSSSLGDIRFLDQGQRFDVVLALFHVVSYLPTNEDLEAAFERVKEHLKSGGLLIFDCWYGPGVLSDPPNIRVKRLENTSIRVTRIAEPEMHPNENLVDVNYSIGIVDNHSGVCKEIKEKHKMRYLFRPEIEYYLNGQDICLLEHFAWMEHIVPTHSTWNAVFVGQAK